MNVVTSLCTAALYAANRKVRIPPSKDEASRPELVRLKKIYRNVPVSLDGGIPTLRYCRRRPFRLLCGCTFLSLLRVFMPLPCLLPQLLASSPLFCCFASPAAPPCSSQAQSAGSVYMPCGCTHKCTKRGASRHQESAKGKSNERQLEAIVVEPRAGQQKPAEGKSNGM